MSACQKHRFLTRYRHSLTTIVTDAHLIESAFPLRRVSLDSVHEKNARHLHISTLYVWPARWRLTARLATLPREPDGEKELWRLVRRMAGGAGEVAGRIGEATVQQMG